MKGVFDRAIFSNLKEGGKNGNTLSAQLKGPKSIGFLLEMFKW